MLLFRRRSTLQCFFCVLKAPVLAGGDVCLGLGLRACYAGDVSVCVVCKGTVWLGVDWGCG